MVTTRQTIQELEKQHDALVNENHHTEARELWDTKIQPLVDQLMIEQTSQTEEDRQVVDRMAGIIRSGLVAAGISDDMHTYESLPEHRKVPHQIAAQSLFDAGFRVVTPQELQAVRFSATVVRYAMESDSEEASEMIHEAYHYCPAEDQDNGSYRDHVEALQGLFGSEQIITSGE